MVDFRDVVPEPSPEPVFMLPAALKSQQWELAKGHLRALVALQGSYRSQSAQHDTSIRYRHLDACVEGFIKTVEDDGLHE